MHDPLKDLSQLTDALYRAELNKMRDINAREASLRHDIAELENLRRSNSVIPPNELHVVRQIGADVLWEGWVSRTRTDLNIQLARVLAQKEHMTVALRHAFGKQIAAAKIRNTADKIRLEQNEKRRRQFLEDLQLMGTCSG